MESWGVGLDGIDHTARQEARQQEEETTLMRTHLYHEAIEDVNSIHPF